MAAPLLLLAAPLALFDVTRHVLFVHVPKTGGSAIENALSAYDPWSVVLPCGRYGDSCVSGVAPVKAACQAREPSLRTPGLNGETLFYPLWHNQVHITDTMFRCMLDLYFPQLRVQSSFALIRHPVDRVISSWHWTIGHQTERAGRLRTFENYVNDPVDGLPGQDEMAVPQCAFVATTSGLLHCLTPTNSSDRVTNVFAYTNDFRNSPALFGYLESFFPGLWMDHANTQAENLNSSNESRSIMADDGLFRLGSTVAIPLAACQTILERYSADMDLYFSLEAEPAVSPASSGVPSGMVTALECSALYRRSHGKHVSLMDEANARAGASGSSRSSRDSAARLGASLQPANS